MAEKKKKYWLMKTEPNVYSIDDLALGKNKGIWDGIRNYQARNFLRDSMQVGDLAIIYHSSIKEPVAYGIGEIMGEPFADPTQFDKKSEYFDATSDKKNPKWISRTVKFVRKFKNPITIYKMRQNPKLKDLILLKRGMRLSVQPVSLSNFEEIVKMSAQG